MTDTTPKLNERQRAFKRYKKAVAEHGKPFFPYGVWHDLIAAVLMVAIIIGLSVVWFAQANCNSWTNVSCEKVATPVEQEEHKPLLGPLYEEKADPGTSSYHPRPEWYFYFLFYLLILFSHPQMVLLGTVIVPTILLVLLLAWPFIDRKRERRPSRRPLAMTGMVATAITLLAFTWLGSQSGVEKEAKLSADQKKMPGYALLFEDERGKQCGGCHVIAGSFSGTMGPDLTDEATKKRGIEWQFEHLRDPQSKVPGSGMIAFDKTYEAQELLDISAFLETLGEPDRATDSQYTSPPMPAGAEGADDGTSTTAAGEAHDDMKM